MIRCRGESHLRQCPEGEPPFSSGSSCVLFAVAIFFLTATPAGPSFRGGKPNCNQSICLGQMHQEISANIQKTLVLLSSFTLDNLRAREVQSCPPLAETTAIAWDVLWPHDKLRTRDFHVFAMEMLAAMDISLIRYRQSRV